MHAAGAAGPAADLLLDVMAATFHKAAELCSLGGGNFPVPTVITTDTRKKILADRKEAARLEASQAEARTPRPSISSSTQDRVFGARLDSVDDLKEGKGAEYVDASSVTLVFCTSGS